MADPDRVDRTITVEHEARAQRGLRWARWAVAALLALLLLGYWIYVDFLRPAPFYTIKYDPEMPYLLNSLAPFKSHPYAYFHHPGTPVELLGTLLLAVLKTAARLPADPFVERTLANPGDFLRLGHGTVTAISALTAALLVVRSRPIRVWRDLLITSGIGVTYFAIHPPYSFDSLAFWSHNSFAFAGGTLLLVLVSFRLMRPDPLPVWQVALFGILAGWLAAVQLYFATWALGIAVAAAGHAWGETGRFGRGLTTALALTLSGLVGFLTATLPILHRYRDLVWWLRGIAVHQGMFGSGPVGVTSPARLGANLADLWQGRGAMVLGLSGVALAGFMACAALSRGKGRLSPGWLALGAGLCVQLVVTTALIVKHPRPTYLLALAGTLPPLLILITDGLDRLGRPGRTAAVALAAALVPAFFGSGVQSVLGHHGRLDKAQRAEQELQTVIDQYSAETGKPPDQIAILWGFGTPSRCFALRFGNGYADRIFTAEIEGLCPREGLYNIWEGVIEEGLGGGRLDENEQWDILVVSQEHTRQAIADGVPVLVSAESGMAYYVREATP